MKTCSMVFTISIIFFLTAGCEQAKHVRLSGNSVKIGIIGPMSGADNAWGKSSLQGIETALKFQPTLDNGDLIELVVEDDRNKPELAIQALTKLVEDDAVSSVIVISSSEVVLALVDLAEELKTPVFAITSTHPSITKNNHYISQLLFDDHFQASIAALYIRDELLADHVGVATDKDNPHSEYLAMQFIDKFTATGGSCADISINSNEAELLHQLKFLQTQKINYLYLPLESKHVITIAKMLQQINYHPVIMSSDALQATIILQYPDSLYLVDGILATGPYSNTIPLTKYGKILQRTFKDLFSSRGTVMGGQGAEGISMLSAAINRCTDHNDRACINTMLRTTRNFEGLFGKISITPDGKAERPIFINVLNDGDLQDVVKVY